jgi:DNA polymerase I-like protein with 3'-5' exonuclease and polymerase domains
VVGDTSPLLPNTKVVLHLGQKALDNSSPFKLTLNEARGCHWTSSDGIHHLTTYAPQDTFDFKAAFEREGNSYLQSDNEDSISQENSLIAETSLGEKKTGAKTGRENYRFWLARDIEKVKKLLQGAFQPHTSDTRFYANSNEVIENLLSTKRNHLYLDIETDEDLNLTCFGYAFDHPSPIYCVPVFRFNNALAYSQTELLEILRALVVAMRDNVTVCHNSLFDLFVLAWKYNLPVGSQIYDTMLAHARLYPGVEKSLGHCASIYTYEPYHKNEGVFHPKTTDQDLQLWNYNAKDILVTREIKNSIDARAVQAGAVESIAQVNASIRPYLISTLQGIKYKEDKLKAIMAENDRKMNALLRVSRYLVNHDFLPTSSTQCVNYFHNEVGLPVVKKSKTGKPSLDAKAMLKLAVSHDHPMIPLTLEFRRLSKQSGSLKFTPWVLDDDSQPMVEETLEQEINVIV